MRVEMMIITIVLSLIAGATLMGLWMHAEVVHYKKLYKQIRAEKKAMADDYNKRLEELGKTLGVYTVMESLDISKLNPVTMPPLEASDSLFDHNYT